MRIFADIESSDPIREIRGKESMCFHLCPKIKVDVDKSFVAAKILFGGKAAMQTQKKYRRVTKEGCFFSGLRISGLLLKVFGGLTFLAGILGFIISLFRTSSDLISAFQNFDQQMAQFGFTLIMVWLGTFVAVGCTGLVMLGIGFGLDFAATEPVAASMRPQPIDKPLSPA